MVRVEFDFFQHIIFYWEETSTCKFPVSRNYSVGIHFLSLDKTHLANNFAIFACPKLGQFCLLLDSGVVFVECAGFPEKFQKYHLRIFEEAQILLAWKKPGSAEACKNSLTDATANYGNIMSEKEKNCNHHFTKFK